MAQLTETQVRQIVEDELKKSQYRVGGNPYHLHNGIDAPFVYLPFSIQVGNGVPTGIAPEGTLYVNKAAYSTTTRFYISTGTTWGYFTASA